MDLEEKRIERARRLVQRYGTQTDVARICGVDKSVISRILKPKSAGGTGGRINEDYQERLIAYARRHGIKLDPNDFLPPSIKVDVTELTA